MNDYVKFELISFAIDYKSDDLYDKLVKGTVLENVPMRGIHTVYSGHDGHWLWYNFVTQQKVHSQRIGVIK